MKNWHQFVVYDDNANECASISAVIVKNKISHSDLAWNPISKFLTRETAKWPRWVSLDLQMYEEGFEQ